MGVIRQGIPRLVLAGIQCTWEGRRSTESTVILNSIFEDPRWWPRQDIDCEVHGRSCQESNRLLHGKVLLRLTYTIIYLHRHTYLFTAIIYTCLLVHSFYLFSVTLPFAPSPNHSLSSSFLYPSITFPLYFIHVYIYLSNTHIISLTSWQGTIFWTLVV